MFAAKDIWVAVEVFSFRDADMTTGMVFSSGLSRPSSCQIRYWRRETLTWSKDDDASGKMISIFTFLESVPSSSFVKKHRLFFLSDHDGDDGFFAYLLLPETDHHLPLLQVVLLFFRHKFLASVHDSRLWPLLWENDHLSFAWNHHDDPFARFRLCFISYFSWQTRVAWTAGAVAWTWEETTTVEEVLLESLLFPLPVILRYFSFPFFERCRLSSHQSHRRPVSFKEEKRRTTCSSCLQNPWQSFFTLKVFFHHSSSSFREVLIIVFMNFWGKRRRETHIEQEKTTSLFLLLFPETSQRIHNENCVYNEWIFLPKDKKKKLFQLSCQSLCASSFLYICCFFKTLQDLYVPSFFHWNQLWPYSSQFSFFIVIIITVECPQYSLPSKSLYFYRLFL